MSSDTNKPRTRAEIQRLENLPEDVNHEEISVAKKEMEIQARQNEIKKWKYTGDNRFKNAEDLQKLHDKDVDHKIYDAGKRKALAEEFETVTNSSGQCAEAEGKLIQEIKSWKYTGDNRFKNALQLQDMHDKDEYHEIYNAEKRKVLAEELKTCKEIKRITTAALTFHEQSMPSGNNSTPEISFTESKGMKINPADIVDPEPKGTKSNPTDIVDPEPKGTKSNPTDIVDPELKGTKSNPTEIVDPEPKGTKSNPAEIVDPEPKGTKSNPTDAVDPEPKGIKDNPVNVDANTGINMENEKEPRERSPIPYKPSVRIVDKDDSSIVVKPYTPAQARKNRLGSHIDGKVVYVQNRDDGEPDRCIIQYGPKIAAKYEVTKDDGLFTGDAIKIGPDIRIGDEKLGRKFVRKRKEFLGFIWIALPEGKTLDDLNPERKKRDKNYRYPETRMGTCWTEDRFSVEVASSVIHMFKDQVKYHEYIFDTGHHFDKFYQDWLEKPIVETRTPSNSEARSPSNSVTPIIFPPPRSPSKSVTPIIFPPPQSPSHGLTPEAANIHGKNLIKQENIDVSLTELPSSFSPTFVKPSTETLPLPSEQELIEKWTRRYKMMNKIPLDQKLTIEEKKDLFWIIDDKLS